MLKIIQFHNEKELKQRRYSARMGGMAVPGNVANLRMQNSDK